MGFLVVFTIIIYVSFACYLAAKKNRSVLVWGLMSLLIPFFAFLVLCFLPVKLMPKKEKTQKVYGGGLFGFIRGVRSFFLGYFVPGILVFVPIVLGCLYIKNLQFMVIVIVFLVTLFAAFFKRLWSEDKLFLISFAMTVVWVLFGSGLHVPYMAQEVHSKIRAGMSGNEVKHLASVAGGGNISCDVVKNQKTRHIYEDSKCYKIISQLSRQVESESVVLKVFFMGPVFWKSGFDVTFGKDGKVEKISSIRGWD